MFRGIFVASTMVMSDKIASQSSRKKTRVVPIITRSFPLYYYHVVSPFHRDSQRFVIRQRDGELAVFIEPQYSVSSHRVGNILVSLISASSLYSSVMELSFWSDRQRVSELPSSRPEEDAGYQNFISLMKRSLELDVVRGGGRCC